MHSFYYLFGEDNITYFVSADRAVVEAIADALKSDTQKYVYMEGEGVDR